MVPFCRIAAAVLLVLFSLPGVAMAQPAEPAPATKPAPTEDEIVRAQALYDRATELYNDKNYAEAVIFYERALALVGEPDIEYNIAKCYEKLAQYENAIIHYESYLRRHKEVKGTDAPDAPDVLATVQDLKRRGAPKKVKLSVTSDPAGANVYLGGRDQLVGQTPYETELDPGKYVLIVEMDGYEPEEQQIALERGEPRGFTFKLRRQANMGALRFDVNVRGARLYVQGQVKGLTPYEEEILVPAGRRQVTVEKERYTTATRMVDVTAGKTVFVREDLYLDDPPYSWRGYVGWTSVGLGVVGIAGGVVIKVVGDGKFFTSEPTFKDLQTYQAVAYGVGGGLLALGTGLVIWEYVRDDVASDDLLTPEERLRTAPLPPVSMGILPDGGVTITGQARF